MSVADILEEMNLVLACEERGTDTVNGCVAPTFIVEAAFLIKVVEELRIRLTSPEVKVADLKVAPDCGVK